jgi:hypothetical protein
MRFVTMRSVSLSRPAGSKLSLSIAVAACAALMASGALAQDAACEDLGKKLNAYGQLMQRAQGFQKKKPTPDEACSLFTNLQNASKAVIPALDQNGAWCHVPDQAMTNIKAQQDQIAKVRASACQVAAQMKKQQQQQGPAGGGLLGGGDVLGGPMRVPQGAL